MPPVTTSLPLLNSSRVQLGFARRIVMAANFFRSYEDPGVTSLIPRRSMGIRLLSICAVDTMLWIMGVGVSSPSSPPPRLGAAQIGFGVRARGVARCQRGVEPLAHVRCLIIIKKRARSAGMEPFFLVVLQQRRLLAQDRRGVAAHLRDVRDLAGQGGLGQGL